MPSMVKILSTLRRHVAIRSAFWGLAIVVALLGAAVVSSLTLDVGPIFRPAIESYLSRLVQRPVRVGRMRINILSGLLLGRVQLEDVTIQGRIPSDRPFFTARTLSASIDWWPAIARRPNISITAVELDDWEMLVEKWKDGDSFPRFRRNTQPDAGPRPFTATLRSFRGSRGRFTYEDHESPWSVFAPGVELTIGNLPKYSGRVASKGGLISIQDYVPMWSDFNIRFDIDGDIIHLTNIDLTTDGAHSTASGDLDMAHWPEQRYTGSSHVRFQRMREIFFAREEWPLK